MSDSFWVLMGSGHPLFEKLQTWLAGEGYRLTGSGAAGWLAEKEEIVPPPAARAVVQGKISELAIP